MTWFKVDDKLHDHRKARAAGATAMGVWLLAGSWAADNLTDGFIPAAVLPRWGRPRDAKRLVDVGLWHADQQDGEEGWRFHEWDERQPSRAQTLEIRAAKAEAGRKGGLHSGQSRREAKSKQSASTLVEPPTRPEPDLTTTSPASADAERVPDGFDDFWAAYPRKKDKGHGGKAFRSALKRAKLPDILEALERDKRTTWANRATEHIPYPATWLNGNPWDDEPDQSPAADLYPEDGTPEEQDAWLARHPAPARSW